MRVVTYVPGIGWGSGITLATSSASLRGAYLDFAEDGTGSAVWSQGSFGSPGIVRFSRFLPSTGWSAPIDLVADASFPSLSRGQGGELYLLYSADGDASIRLRAFR